MLSNCHFRSPPCWVTKLNLNDFLIVFGSAQLSQLNSASLSATSFMNTVILPIKTVCHITSNIRGFSCSLSLSVWQLHVAYGKQHHIISSRLRRLPEEDCEIRLRLYVILIEEFNVSTEKSPCVYSIFRKGWTLTNNIE